MKKKEKEIEENKTTKMIKEIKGILDEDYFHINVKLNEKFRGGIEWAVYYKNLYTDDYFSEKNKSLLTSRRNTIADIYILKDIFEKLKQETVEEAGFEFFRDNKRILNFMKEIKETSSIGMINIFTIYTFVNIVIILITNNFIVAFINLFLCILVNIYLSFKNKKMNKLLNEAEDVKEKILLKNIIKGQGFEFVKKIRKELHNKGVYKYGINEKTRKTTNKSI